MAESFLYGGNTILQHPLFVETILPFLLVFTLVFAVLQKSKILGDGKKQIDAIVALSMGLLVLAFAEAVGIIIQMTYFVAVALVVILVLMLLLGSFAEPGKFFEKFPSGLKTWMTIVVVLAVVIATMIFTGGWQYVLDLIFISEGSGILVNVIFVAIVIGAVVFVLWMDKGSSSS